jgi:hypothetical protein
VQPELGNHALKVSRPAIGNRGRADRVLENQIPADHPGEQLAERCVGIGVGRSGHWHHRRKFGVAQRRENAGHAGEDVGKHQRGTGHIVGGGARRDENPGANHRANPQTGQLDRTEDPAQTILALHFLQQLFERLRREQLAH